MSRESLIIFHALFVLFGVAFGSFGNVVIFRGIERKSLGGRSQCPSCKKILNAFELIPVLSFLIQRGRCRRCKATLSWQYPLVETASGLLFLLAFWHEQGTLLHAFLLALCLWLLLLIAVFDGRTGFIPDVLSIPFIVLALLYALLMGTVPYMPVLIACAFFGGQWAVSRGRWLGSGDILLAVGIAALLIQVDLFLLSLFFAYVIGALVAAVLLLQKRTTLQSSLPFGPFLVLGAMISLFCGECVLRFFLL